MKKFQFFETVSPHHFKRRRPLFDGDIHQYPELGFDVHRTAGIAADALHACA